MYAIVRELNIKPAFKEENQRRVTDELLPQVREIPGFVDFYLIYTGNETEISVGLFRDKKGVEELNRIANAFVKKTAPNIHLTNAYEGEVVAGHLPLPV